MGSTGATGGTGSQGPPGATGVTGNNGISGKSKENKGLHFIHGKVWASLSWKLCKDTAVNEHESA